MRLKDKVAVVTGAGSGIGKAIALAFAREGAKVIVNDHSAEAAAATAGEIARLKLSAHGICSDISRLEQVRAMFTETDRIYGSVDILVNNAGISCVSKPFFDAALARMASQGEEIAKNGEITTHLNVTRDMSDEEWDGMMAVNLFGTFYCAREALKRMSQNRGGAIINISSRAAQSPVGSIGLSHYAASKAAVLGFTRTLAVEVASQGIRVNAIAPGLIETPMLSAGKNNPNFKRGVLTKVPLGRPGLPEEVASVAVFLASNESSYLTGQTLNANGGAYMP